MFATVPILHSSLSVSSRSSSPHHLASWYFLTQRPFVLHDAQCGIDHCCNMVRRTASHVVLIIVAIWCVAPHHRTSGTVFWPLLMPPPPVVEQWASDHGDVGGIRYRFHWDRSRSVVNMVQKHGGVMQRAAQATARVMQKGGPIAGMSRRRRRIRGKKMQLRRSWMHGSMSRCSCGGGRNWSTLRICGSSYTLCGSSYTVQSYESTA